jgi:hypothetical protein
MWKSTLVAMSLLMVSAAGCKDRSRDQVEDDGGEEQDSATDETDEEVDAEIDPDDASSGTEPDANADEHDSATEPPEASTEAGAVSDAGTPDADAGAVNRCPGQPPLDTDGDGEPDACDVDDDNDGFRDPLDPAPLDATRPGDFSTPEKILTDSRVKRALDAIQAKGIAFPTHMELSPPDVSGLYTEATNSYKFVATGNNQNVGSVSPVGSEFRVTLSGSNLVDNAGLLFSGNSRFSYASSKGSLLRGAGSSFTTYSYGKETCEAGTAPYSEYGIVIASAVQQANGDWQSVMRLHVTVATEGTYTTPCNLGGDSEFEGGWQLNSNPLAKKISVADLRFMCKGKASAYVAKESWTEADGAMCSCSDMFETTCTP